MLSNKILVNTLIFSILTACGNSEVNNIDLTQSISANQSSNIQSTAKERQKKEFFVNELASILHNTWREARRKADGTFEPRIKETKDQEWIAKNGKNQVDIANTAYPLLPADWQAENKASAEVATNLVFTAIEKNKAMDSKFIEDSSNKIHIAWLNRPNNSYAKGGPLDVAYSKLDEVEKEKDRVVIKEAIQLAKDLNLVKAPK